MNKMTGWDGYCGHRRECLAYCNSFTYHFLNSFGFVQYKKGADAKNALANLNGLDIAGRPIKVITHA
eukprot:31686-Amorphochlora_amoeboformis.AAC.1